jgi:hypothetical protein
MPLPLGYRKQEGRSSMAAAVATMWQSSASSDGAMTTMLGRHAMYVTSNAPQWVGPSAPTSPALSIANLTGSFWRSTSCTTCAATSPAGSGVSVTVTAHAEEEINKRCEERGTAAGAHLVVAALQEGRVDGAERLEALAGEAGRERDGVLLGDPDVEAAVGEAAEEVVKPRAAAHGGVDGDDLAVLLGLGDERLGEVVGVGQRLGRRLELLPRRRVELGDAWMRVHRTTAKSHTVPAMHDLLASRKQA